MTQTPKLSGPQTSSHKAMNPISKSGGGGGVPSSEHTFLDKTLQSCPPPHLLVSCRATPWSAEAGTRASGRCRSDKLTINDLSKRIPQPQPTPLRHKNQMAVDTSNTFCARDSSCVQQAQQLSRTVLGEEDSLHPCTYWSQRLLAFPFSAIRSAHFGADHDKTAKVFHTKDRSKQRRKQKTDEQQHV